MVLLFVLFIAWLCFFEKRWPLLSRLLAFLNRRTGISLPLVSVSYVFIAATLVAEYFAPSPRYSHAGAAEFSALLVSAFVIITVSATAIYDFFQRKWHAAISIALSLAMFPVWGFVFSYFVNTGRIILVE